MNEIRKFKMIDEAFICRVCGNKVESLGYTARDHCPRCLCSIHVDINPGDRACSCNGTLKPVSVDKKKDNYKIVYKCERCRQIKHNIMAKDDNLEELLRILRESAMINK